MSAHDWPRAQALSLHVPELDLLVDLSKTGLADDALRRHPLVTGAFPAAFAAMDALEKGALANPDEKRRVGHYWLRAPERAPDAGTAEAIRGTLARIEDFASAVHAGRVAPEKAPRFENLLVVGIGGSALGPQFVADALGSPRDPLKPFFFDNTDPDGMARELSRIAATDGGLPATLTVVISKSGGTKETRNGMLVAADAYARAGLDFAKHAVAVTGDESELDEVAATGGWLERFPMWDWVGGRTSELSAVGLLPGGAPGARHPGDALGRGGLRRGDARPRRRPEPGGDARARVARRDGRPRREGHGRPPLQGPAPPLLALPPAARHGIPRQGERPRGPRREPGNRRLRQQGLDGPARVRPAAARGRSELLRRRSSRSRRTASRRRALPRGRGRRHARRLPARLPPRDEEGARRERPHARSR